MTARSPARRFLLRAAGALFGVGTLSASAPGCYPGGGAGTAPPPDAFYFPVGLAVSAGGNVLYAVNSDFDLQWNGGTLQSYDLFHLRHDTAELINANFTPPSAADPEQLLLQQKVNSDISFGVPWQAGCMSPSLVQMPFQGNGSRDPLGAACSPPVNSAAYIDDSAIIGAFATDLQISRDGTRLFAPVRGDGSLTWADLVLDSPDNVPPVDQDIAAPGVSAWMTTASSTGPTSPAAFYCGAGADLRCDARHHTGAIPDRLDTRLLTLPGEPFAMAQSEDGTAIVITHQTTTETSLLMSGRPAVLSGEEDAPLLLDGGLGDEAGPPAASDADFDASSSSVDATTGTMPEASTAPSGPPSPFAQSDPSMQFVLSGVPSGGDGIVAVPHDPDGPVPPCELVGSAVPCVRPAFLETSHNVAEIDLLRYYDDDGSSVARPFLVREAAYPITANIGGTDSRDIVIDSTQRDACKKRSPSDIAACAEIPARVFFASRTPPALVIGEIGEPSITATTGYDPDRLVIKGNLPVSNGASRVYLAPIIDRTGHYALRVFVVCFDAAQIFVYDPNAGMIENVINVAPGPFAMAFDPFDLKDVAAQSVVPIDVRQNLGSSLKTYRFAYLASFTQSFVQVIDLDDSLPPASLPFPVGGDAGAADAGAPVPPPSNGNSNVTFEHVVFTLGQPTNPKGS